MTNYGVNPHYQDPYGGSSIADGLSGIVSAIIGDPERVAKMGLYGAQTRQADASTRHADAQTGLLSSELNGRNGLANTVAGLGGTYTSEQAGQVARFSALQGPQGMAALGHFQNAAGAGQGVPQARQDQLMMGAGMPVESTQTGLGQTLAQRNNAANISAGAAIAGHRMAADASIYHTNQVVGQQRDQFNNLPVEVMENGAPVYRPRSGVMGGTPVLSEAQARGSVTQGVAANELAGRPVSNLARMIALGDNGRTPATGAQHAETTDQLFARTAVEKFPGDPTSQAQFVAQSKADTHPGSTPIKMLDPIRARQAVTGEMATLLNLRDPTADPSNKRNPNGPLETILAQLDQNVLAESNAAGEQAMKQRGATPSDVARAKTAVLSKYYTLGQKDTSWFGSPSLTPIFKQRDGVSLPTVLPPPPSAVARTLATPPAPGGPPMVSTPGDYARVMPGSQYRDPQGNLRTKPGT